MTKSVVRLEAGKRSRMLVSLAVAGAAAVALTAGGATGSSASSAAEPSGSAPISATAGSSPAAVVAVPALAVRRTSLGTILTDGRGFTLYAFAADRGSRSRCFGACAVAWPPLTTTTPIARLRVGRGVVKSHVGQTTRSRGVRQLTYAGHPLYRYQDDRRPGSTRGQGSTAFGARWNVLTPAGRLVR